MTTLGRPTHVLGITVTVVVIVVALTCVWTIHYVNHANSVRRDEQVATCERGNKVRINLNAVAAHLELNLPVLPILDCPNTIH